ncbi:MULTISPECIES: spinster family MFS transporter [Burkholderia]|jgi:MFS family permease|uniref:MFS transporter n=1 Tax=Burkholderia contaminans TaxID=488447 RepID=A0A250LH74_9BURK|nr:MULTISPECIES: MFS transporter [Burkholderia]UTP27147.1 MFS transporter [Burkholderia sp. FXe9]MBA9832919.1 MFS transporter [Burkholderia contaminans]MBA9841133.1 MFS transporter [Burkholderia contaminans]MBA9866465.1 MFS transporter [Burkholderia contaminans]MBA9909032.1 MFS transporter [Burkholderia contaminans]
MVLEKHFPSQRYAWSLVFVLFCASVVSYLDRYILSLFVGPIRGELGLSDTQVSLLQGAAFALFYAVMGLPFGRLVDRYTRKNLIVAGILVWSAMTMLCGVSTSFWQLFFARMGVGVGEACLGPAAFSMIADSFPQARRGRALATYNMSNYVGVGASLLFGGLIISLLSHANNSGFLHMPGVQSWRIAFIASALPGVLLAFVVLTLKEPARTELVCTNSGSSSNAFSLWSYLRARKPAFASVYTVYALTAMVGYIIVAWAPSFYMRHFHMRPADVGLSMGVLSIVAGVGGCLFSGYLSDRWVAAGAHGGRFRIPLLWWPIALVSIVGITHSPNATASLICLGVLAFGSALGLSSAPAVIQDVVPNQLRGQAAALHFIFAGLIGLSLGPTAVAIVTDYVLHDASQVGVSLQIVIVPLSLVGFAACWLGQSRYHTVRAELVAMLENKAADTLPKPGHVSDACNPGQQAR